jgi:glycosyltransferase involved in cell wall biosynthesis
MQKILFLIPSMDGGGAEKATLLLCNELSSRGWDVSILLCKSGGPYLKRLNEKIKIIILKKENISYNIIEIASYLKAIKPDIFYSSMMYANVIAGLAVIWSSYAGKLFFSEHSHPSISLRLNSASKSKLILSLAKLVYKKADAVICVSQGVKEDLLQLIKKLENAVVIYNPVENLYQKDIVPDPDIYRLVSIGRLDKNKNFKLLVDCFAEVLNEVNNGKKYELHILGEGEERGNLEKQVAVLNLNDKVFLSGFVSNPANILNSSQLFVSTSLLEGLPTVLIEALGCGLPVISSDCRSGPAEILLDGKVGALVPVNNKAALKDAIIKEIRHPNFTSTKELRMERADEFKISTIVNKYETLFGLKADFFEGAC